MAQRTRIVALEEHFTIPALVQRIDREVMKRRGWPLEGAPAAMSRQPQLADLGAPRLADMDSAGITLQVLSASGPGADLLDGDDGVRLARDYNDALAAIVAEHPSRYAGFAHLPMRDPHAAADELERAVTTLRFKRALINGMTQELFLDDPHFAPLLARAESLDVPIYIHPNIPPEAVRRLYYENLPKGVGAILSAPGWGWHSETAVHVLRLVVSGTLERHPTLKLIIGHMGEGLPMMLTRLDDTFSPTATYLTRSVSRTILDQVWITTSGFFSLPPFLAALTAFGAERILFSVDYPFSTNARGRAFLDALPVSPADRHRIAYGNADELLKLR